MKPPPKAPGRKELTHERIVDVAATMIRDKGYAGTGVADVMNQAGLTHGGFYAHFESRDQLLAEALDRAAGKSLERMRQAAGRVGPEDALRGFVDWYLSDAHLEAPENGCSLAALGSETPRQAADVRKASGRRLKEVIDFIERQMPDWGRPGQHEKALAIMSCLVGAMVMARAADDKRVAKDVRKAARALIERVLD